MKLVTAIIKPERLDSVKNELKAAGVGGMTITEAKGFGVQGGSVEMWRGAEYVADQIPKTEIKVVVDDEFLGRAVAAILHSARTGSIGDGKIWVTEVQNVIRIRTGEEDSAAL